jgi:hypothetical protein
LKLERRQQIYSERRKSSHRRTGISWAVFWNLPNQTLACSTADELKTHFPFSPISSRKRAGLQLTWQNPSRMVCLHLKWKTSTGRPTLSKYGSPRFLRCFKNWQLLS